MRAKDFDKNLSAVMILQKFLTDYSDGKDITETYEYFINKLSTDEKRKPENLRVYQERRKIIEHCRDLFKDISIKKCVDAEIATFRAEINSTEGKKPTDSQTAKRLLQVFSEKFWGIDKRTYDMSRLATKRMLSTVKNADGNVSKVVAYVSFEDLQKKRPKENNDKQTSDDEKKKEPPQITLHDKHGNSICIQFMGCLAYKTLSSNEYIYKHHITKNINGVETSDDVFSNIDIFALQYNKELRDVVVSELLSTNNIERSNADGYIGEISEQKSPSLEPGDEKIDYQFYTYQITPKYALVYDGERIEAIRAYKQQEAMKSEQAKATEQPDEYGR